MPAIIPGYGADPAYICFVSPSALCDVACVIRTRVYILSAFCLLLIQAVDAVTVYIMDNGIRADHEAFAGIEMESVDLQVERGEGGAAYGEHATHVAGLVIERAPSVKLVSVRTLDEQGAGKWSDFIKGVHWITNHHRPGEPAVANLSLGGVPENPRIKNLVTQAVDKLVASGVVVVVAAGNDGDDVPDRIPSTLESVISVGASGRLVSRLRNSNFGSCADLFALGENLRGPSARSRKARRKDSGTSMAAAVVTGHVASYLAGAPAATPGEVKAWVLENSPDGGFRFR